MIVEERHTNLSLGSRIPNEESSILVYKHQRVREGHSSPLPKSRDPDDELQLDDFAQKESPYAFQVCLWYSPSGGSSAPTSILEVVVLKMNLSTYDVWPRLAPVPTSFWFERA